MILVQKLDEKRGGGWLAQDLTRPGCMSDGETPAAACASLEDAQRCWDDTAARKTVDFWRAAL